VKKKYIPFIVVALVLFIDQFVKIWVKTNMQLGEGFQVLGLNWFQIHFTENEGMAFGMTLGGDYGKLFLTLFRLFAIGFIGFYLYKLLKKGAGAGLLVCISLILAGAIGNIVDSVFYGLIFSHSNGQVASLMPEGGGYGTLFHGNVVDMLYFPLYSGNLPGWIPFVGGDHFTFFRPVFNLADSAITCGVIAILIFQKRFFGKGLKARGDDIEVRSMDTGEELSETKPVSDDPKLDTPSS
jgi:signal peptidase II